MTLNIFLDKRHPNLLTTDWESHGVEWLFISSEPCGDSWVNVTKRDHGLPPPTGATRAPSPKAARTSHHHRGIG
jgi:hypothetical protein